MSVVGYDCACSHAALKSAELLCVGVGEIGFLLFSTVTMLCSHAALMHSSTRTQRLPKHTHTVRVFLSCKSLNTHTTLQSKDKMRRTVHEKREATAAKARPLRRTESVCGRARNEKSPLALLSCARAYIGARGARRGRILFCQRIFPWDTPAPASLHD